MKKLLLQMLFSILATTLSAQQTENDDVPVNIKNAEKGYLIDKNNKKINSYIILKGNDNDPWNNQRIVKAAEIDKIDKSAEKVKFSRYTNSDISGYGVGGRKFELIEFTNMRASAKQSQTGQDSSIFDTMNAVKNLAKQKHFAEVIVDGPYKVYKLYAYPKNFDAQVGQQAIDEKKEEMIEMRTKPSLLVQAGKDKIKFIRLADFEGYSKNCKVVSKKLADGGYDSLGYSRMKKSGLMGKMMKLAENNNLDNTYNQDLILAFFNDLNENCK